MAFGQWTYINNNECEDRQLINNTILKVEGSAEIETEREEGIRGTQVEG